MWYAFLKRKRLPVSEKGCPVAKRKWTRQEVEDWRKKHNSWFYCNKEDANIFVRKRCYGINWAFNLGNPLSWVIMAVFAGVILLVAISQMFL